MNHGPEIKMVRGSVVIKLQPDHVDQLTEENLLELLNKIKNREHVIHFNHLEWIRLQKILKDIKSLKRKRYITDYHFDLEEYARDIFRGTITLCYNEIH